MEYTFEKKRLFSEQKRFFLHFRALFSLFMLILVRNREFSSCSLAEICKFHKNGNKANAHAGMPFCGMLQFVMPTFLVGLWSYRPRATARLGRGSFVFIGY